MGAGFSHPNIRGCYLLTVIRMGPSQAPQCLDNQVPVGFEQESGPQLLTNLSFSPSPPQNWVGYMQVRTLAGQKDGAGETGAED